MLPDPLGRLVSEDEPWLLLTFVQPQRSHAELDDAIRELGVSCA